MLITAQKPHLCSQTVTPQRWIVEKLLKHVKNDIHEKGYRDNPMTKEQKESNRIKSKTRCRIEHVFGFMIGAMHGITRAA